MKVCLVGANAGCKTRLVRKHVRDEFDDRYIWTLGAKVSKKVLRLGTTSIHAPVDVHLMIWDLIGQEGFRELLRESYLHGTKGILAVSDMTRRSTLRELDNWIASAQSVTGPVPIVVIGANHDKRDRLEMTEEEVTSVARAHGAPAFFASEAIGEGVEAAFRNLADSIVERWSKPKSPR